MTRSRSHQPHRVARPLRTAVTTAVLAPLLLPAALLTLAVAGLGSLLDPAEEFEFAGPEDLWPELPPVPTSPVPAERVLLAA